MTGARPTVSIVITNHNYGCFLPAALQSVLDQSYPPLEIIVVDDGSVDDSRPVLARYHASVRAIFQANGGQAAALDVGVAATSGDLICLLDADDAWTHDKVQRMVEVLEMRPHTMWLRHKLEIADAELNGLGVSTPDIRRTGVISPSIVLAAERIIKASPSALCIRREMLPKVFPLHVSEQLRYDADALLVARLARAYEGYDLDDVLGYYRRHSKQQHSPSDTARLLQRQIEVGSQVAGALGTPEPVSNYRFRAILAAMAGEPLWSRARMGPSLRGLAGVLWRFRAQPATLFRQLWGQLLAWFVPRAWLRRLRRVSGFN